MTAGGDYQANSAFKYTIGYWLCNITQMVHTT